MTKEKRIAPARRAAFRRKVWSYHRAHRRALPWRETFDPYAILVSELMLQQTQIARVLPKYEQFLQQLPDFESLSRASLSTVLRLWQGLGYNRRAKALHQLSQVVVGRHAGILPASFEQLCELPGIGNYTAAALLNFAFQKAHPLIETNVRTVLLHEFFPRSQKVSEAHLLSVVEQTLDRKKPREWFYALMDYGSHLKSIYPGINQRSAAYRKQTPFRGSLRELRGGILRMVSITGGQSTSIIRSSLVQQTGQSQERFDTALAELLDEGLIVIKRRRIELP